MSYIHNRGLGLDFPLPIEQGLDPVMQPSSTIQPMVMINSNPMLPPSDYASGDQAMLQEMQARAGDPGAFQQAGLLPGMTKGVAPTVPLTGDAILMQNMVTAWVAALAGKQVPMELQVMMDQALSSGKGAIVEKARQLAASKLAPLAPTYIAPGEASVAQPTDHISAQGPGVFPPNPGEPVTGQFLPDGPVSPYVAETGLHPAQPEYPIQSAPPPPPTQYDHKVGTIPPGEGSTGTIPPGEGQTGAIPKGTGQTADIPQGQLPPTTSKYTATTPSGYVQSGAGVVAPVAKSNIVPLAIAAGAALLLTKLL